MKFVKGLIIGGMISAGIAMVYSEGLGNTKKKVMKKGKNMAKKMGIM